MACVNGLVMLTAAVLVVGVVGAGVARAEADRIDAAGIEPGQRVEVGELALRVVEADVLPVVENEWSARHRFDRHGNPQLERLREAEKLDELVAGIDAEFEQQLRVLAWSQARLPRFGRPTSPARGALDIIAAADEGHTFFCSHYADTFVGAAASMGWLTRSLALRVGNEAHGSGSTEHAIVEIWSNEHRKWIMVDPTYALYVEKDGQPLNAWEIRQAWFYGERDELQFVVGARGWERFTYADMPVRIAEHPGFGTLALGPRSIDKLALIGYVPNNDLMDAGPDYGAMFISTDERLSEGVQWHRRDNPADPATEPYFPLNQAAMHLEALDAEHLRVHLSTNTPNFDRYEMRSGSEQWVETGPAIDWPLERGRNRLEARSVNRFGVPGPVSALELELE